MPEKGGRRGTAAADAKIGHHQSRKRREIVARDPASKARAVSEVECKRPDAQKITVVFSGYAGDIVSLQVERRRAARVSLRVRVTCINGNGETPDAGSRAACQHTKIRR